MNTFRNWFMDCNTNHKQFFDHCVLSKIIVLFEDYNYKHEENHVIVAILCEEGMTHVEVQSALSIP